MLTAPFCDEVPADLGVDAAWLGREVMQALVQLSRHQPAERVDAAWDEAGTGHPGHINAA